MGGWWVERLGYFARSVILDIHLFDNKEFSMGDRISGNTPDMDGN